MLLPVCVLNSHMCLPQIKYLFSNQKRRSRFRFSFFRDKIMLRGKWITTVRNVFLLLKKQRLIIIEVDLQNAQLYNNHMIPSNFEIEVLKKKEALQKPELWKSRRSCLKYLTVCSENQMPYALFASEEKSCFLLERIAHTGVW